MLSLYLMVFVIEPEHQPGCRMWERLGKGVGMSYAMDFLTYATR
jgi:hypothetical protein